MINATGDRSKLARALLLHNSATISSGQRPLIPEKMTFWEISYLGLGKGK